MHSSGRLAARLDSVFNCRSLLDFARTLRFPIVGIFLLLASVAVVSATPGSDEQGLKHAVGDHGSQRKSVLILSGVQYGLPVTDTLTSGVVAILKEKGVSANNIYVEMLDLVRNRDPLWRARLAELLREKVEEANVGLVVVQNQEALEFLAQEGDGIVPPEIPVLGSLLSNPAVNWRGPKHPVLSVVRRWDIARTVRYGLDVFPRTRRLVVVGGVATQQPDFQTQVEAALASMPEHLEAEDTAGLSYDEMLQRISTLPGDTLVLLGTYYKDKTGRNFIPAEVATEIAKRANQPVLALYDAHIRVGLTGGSVVNTTSVAQRVGEIGFEVLSGTRRIDPDDTEAIVPPEPMFDLPQLQRWGGRPRQVAGKYGIPEPPAHAVERIPVYSAWRVTGHRGAGHPFNRAGHPESSAQEGRGGDRSA